MNRFGSRIARLLPYAALLPPLVAMSMLSLRYGVTIPSVEQLQYVPTMRTVLLEGHWSFSALFWQQPTSDHIAFFPVLAVLLWAPLSGWNIGAELILTPLFSLLNVLLLLRFARHLGGFDAPWRMTTLVFALGLLLFGGRHWAVWTWSMNSLFVFIPFCCLSSLALLSREQSGWKSFSVALGICTIATFSFGNGIATWFAALPLLFVDRQTYKRRRRLLVWLIAATLCGTLYLSQYHSAQTVKTLPIDNPESWFRILRFFFVLWGQSVIKNATAALLLGGAALAMCIALFRRLPRTGQAGRVAATLLGVCIFSAVSAALIAWSRVSMGLPYALESRYGPVMAVGLAVVVIMLLHKLQAFWSALLVIILASLWFVGFQGEMQFAYGQYGVLSQGGTCMRTYRISSDDCLGKLYFGSGGYVRQQAATLEALGYVKQWQPPADTQWLDAEIPHGALESLQRENAASPWVANGWAKHPRCGVETHILLTTGPEHRLIGTTVTVHWAKRTELPFADCWALGWSLVLSDDVMQTVEPKSVEAWIYDEKSNQAIRLPRS